MDNNRCFIEQLAVLKESSKEAVESTSGFSDFKKYMHVERTVQKELEALIDHSVHCNNSQLILVCGSVGDGKSHILSYFKENKPEIMEQFELHNDATASYYKNKSSMDTLNEVLAGFSDENIETSEDKVILAINLGTLNNFIESEYQYRFTKLKAYVEKHKILEDKILHISDGPNEQFHYINFSDYHLYTLEDGRAKSDYIKQILEKITMQDNSNCFYSEYSGLCNNCENSSICPIKANYEMLSNSVITRQLIQKLIEAVVKSKILISTRALFNFIYEILVDKSQIDTGSVSPRQCITNMNVKEYTNALLPNLLYEHPSLSEIFNAITRLDPLNARDERLDEFVIDYLNSNKVMEIYNSYLPMMSKYLTVVENIDFTEAAYSDTKKALLKLFIRSYNLCECDQLFKIEDDYYQKYIYYLYYWNKGNKKELKELYTIVKEGALSWNGECNENEIAIYLGKVQNQFLIKQRVDIKRSVSNLEELEDMELFKFMSNIELKFKNDQFNKNLDVEIDINLFKLLIDVCQGYRPNKKDKNLYIKFNDFINQIESVGSQRETLIFKEKNRKLAKSYKLEFDHEEEEFLFKEIQ